LDPEFLARIEGQPSWVRRSLIELERDILADIEREAKRPDQDAENAAMAAELFTGARLREVAIADRVARLAALRRDSAIRAARAVGYSWAELGRALGVSRQSLRQRYGEAAP
jgi:CRP-like cAMP-binding protein